MRYDIQTNYDIEYNVMFDPSIKSPDSVVIPLCGRPHVVPRDCTTLSIYDQHQHLQLMTAVSTQQTYDAIDSNHNKKGG